MYETGSSTSQRRAPLPSELLTATDIDRISRVFGSPPKKASSLFSGANEEASFKGPVRARALLCPVVSKHFYNVRTSQVEPASVRRDASFAGLRPTVSARFPEAATMRFRSMSIGRGPGNDVDLDDFQICSRTSGRHAVIFYDEKTRHYELIDYSEHGTRVNDVLYSHDPSNGGEPEQSKARFDLSKQVREMVDKRRRIERIQVIDESRMNAEPQEPKRHIVECSCPAVDVPNLESGWEGPALLTHGSLLRFGCVQFVFSIIECATI